MKLFLDDERLPAEHEDLTEWVICRTSAEAIEYVKTCGWPSFISFDHDLGGEDTSMKFLDWAILRILNEDQKTLPFDFYVHSQNPIGAKNIKGKLKSLSYFLEQENWN
jgi:hypothetical protein